MPLNNNNNNNNNENVERIYTHRDVGMVRTLAAAAVQYERPN